MEMENGNELLAPKMRDILASLDSVASAADGITKLLLRGHSNSDLSQQSGSIRLYGRINPPAENSALI